MESVEVFEILFVIFSVLIVCNVVFFRFGSNYKFKKKFFIPFTVSFSVTILLFFYMLALPGKVYYLIVPVVGFLLFMDIKQTKFCANCGKTVRSLIPFVKPKTCSRCQYSLE